MARLRPVPQTAPRAIGLIRVSKERDGMISPDVQRIAIQDYCRARGYTIGPDDWVEGLDESGSRSRSAWWARLDDAVAAVEADRYDVVVVWKFSRTARHRLRWAVAIDRVETAGGRLESATEQVDTTTSTGRFTRGMLAELNAFEAERIGEVWREVQSSRVASGKTPTGLPKWGYVYDRDAQIHRPDPVAGAVLAQLYPRYIAGESFTSLASWLNVHRHPTLKGGMWSAGSIRRVMDTGFAAGLVPYAGEKHPGAHEPLIDAGTWQQYLDARANRHYVPPRARVSRYLLTGMLECERCGGAMSGNQGRTGYPDYRCGRRKTRGPAACSATTVSLRAVEGKVFAWLQDLAAAGIDERAQVRADAMSQRASAEAEVRRLMEEQKKIDESIERVNLLVAEGLMPAADYASTRRLLDERQSRVRELAEEHARLARRSSDHLEVAQRLVDDWDEFELGMKREALRDVLRRVRVRTGGRHEQGEGRARSAAVVWVQPAWSQEWVRL